MDIVLDTNVISELISLQGSRVIRAWIRRRSRDILWTTSTTKAEVLYGIRILPRGQRRQTLMRSATLLFDIDFAGQILGFDTVAAEHYSQIAAHRREIGRPISQFDAQIAAICRAHGAAIATRNVRDFEDCGIEILNPWAD